MRQLFGFILRLAVLTAVAVWLADRPGTAHIVWHDYVIETSAAFLGLSTLTLALLLYFLFRMAHFILHGPKHWRLRRKLDKAQKGQAILTRGMTAVAAGDSAEAGRLAVSARKLLGTTAATQLLQAQAAQLAGDYRSAQEIFRALAADPDSLVLGYRGLIMEARRAQDWETVSRLVGELQQRKPKTPWLNLIRFELLVRKQDWDEAGIALAQVSAARLIEPTRAKQHRAALLIATSQGEARISRFDKALAAAEQAVKLAPDWLPALINLAQQQKISGHHRAAHRTIEKNWVRYPHPKLAAAYGAGHSDAIDAFKQIERLCRGASESPISHLVLAEAALAADIWGEARRHLIALVSRGEATQSAYRLLARLERREAGDEQAAAQWLIKAIDAPVDPVWLCTSCGGAHHEWQATCKHCRSFNTLEWQSPGQSRKTATTLALTTSDLN